MKSVVLLSGGIDSTVCLWMARALGPVTALCVDYGQVAAESERRRAAMLADMAQASFRHVAIPGLGAVLASALTGAGDVAQTAQTVVPGRNAILLSIAAGLAQSIGAESVWIGCNRTDADNYRDCREYFLNNMQTSLEVYSVKVRRPLVGMTKAQVVREAQRLLVPLGATSSCYLGTACGKCAACLTTAAAMADSPPPPAPPTR